MKRHVAILGAVIVLAVIFQGSLVPYVGILGGTFNLLVVIVASVALHYGTEAGLSMGLVTGLLADVVLGRVLGLYAVPLVVIGFITGQLERHVYKDVFLVPVFVGFASTVVYEGVLLLLSRLAFGIWWSGSFFRGSFPGILLNGALMPLAFAIIGRILPKKRAELR